MEKSRCFSAAVSVVLRFYYLSLACTLEIIVPCSSPKAALSLQSTAIQMQYKPAIPAFELNVRLRQIAGDLEDALEAAVGYFELMIAPPFGDNGVAPNTANDQLVLSYQHLDILEFHSGKIELDLPPFRAPVDIDRWLPQRSTRSAVFAADSLDKN